MFRTIFEKENKQWHGMDESIIYHKDISLGNVLLQTMRLSPKKVVQICDDTGKRITNEELIQKTKRASLHLTNFYKIKQGDVIGFIAKNSEYVTPIIFAGLVIGAPINPLDSSFMKREISHMFNLTKPKIIFCDSDILTKVQEAVKDIKLKIEHWVVFGEKKEGCIHIKDLFLPINGEMEFVPPSIGEGDKLAAFIQCSSGTTGLPKGVELSHAQSLDKFGRIDGYTHDDLVLSFSSLYWISGLATLINTTLAGCTRITTTEQITLDLIFQMFEKYRITIYMSSPAVLSNIVNSPKFEKADFSALKYYACGGAAVPMHLIKSMNEKMKNGRVGVVYGLTELMAPISYNIDMNKVGSVGHIRPGFRIKIIDDNGKSLGVDEKGEICVKVPYQFMGYRGLPNTINEILDKDNWLHTGDIGYFDHDGCLYLVDRIKDIIKVGGHQISPVEIEREILKYKDVVSACVIGIPDLMHMNLPAAAVIRTKNSNITEKEIVDHIKS